LRKSRRDDLIRSFSLADQDDFARISGDRNPLHVDPVLARRLLYGGPVVHGIHALLWAMDAFFADMELPPSRIGKLTVFFDAAIAVGEPVRLSIACEPKSGGFRAQISCRDKVTTRMMFSVHPHARMAWDGANAFPEDACRARPRTDLSTASGSIGLVLPTAAVGQRFPALSAFLPPRQIAVLLATTRLVGMECPGLHSIYCGLDLRFSEPRSGNTNEDLLRYRTVNFDERFSFAEIEIEGGEAEGQLTAVLRPEPVLQKPYRESVGLVDPAEFAHINALIIGGSRGLGEATANLVGAGGGDVTLTYHLGREDAGKIVAAIVAHGGRARALHYDALAPRPLDPPPTPYTHCFYFASPRIALSPGPFDSKLFADFLGFYVFGALTAVDLARQQARDDFTFIYPSSIFIETNESGFAEYAAAKAAGEIGCRAAISRHAPARFMAPRFARVRTDQVAAMAEIDAESCESVLLPLLRTISLPSPMPTLTPS
jgi:acyl dehydratase